MRIKKDLITGIATAIPIVVTVYILIYVIRLVDGICQPMMTMLLGRHIPGLGIIATVVILLLVGIFASHAIGRKATELLDRVMLRIPLSRSIYSVMKSISTSFLSEKELGDVVLVKFMPNIYTIGFMTGKSPPEIEKKTSMHLSNIFVPTSPNPTTGLLLMVSDDRILPIEMSTDRGLEIILSAGSLGSETASTS
ncbi:MAG: DUF502 domain-containing protein [Methanotrichaceae archaeon]